MASTKRRRTATADKRLAIHKHLAKIQTEIVKLRHDRAAVKREEFHEMSKSLEQVQQNADALRTQLTRIGQIQQEVDDIKRALKKAGLLD